MHTLSVLFENPFIFPAYLLLILSLIACWIGRKYYLFVPLYALSFTLAYYGGIVELFTLAPLGLVLFCLLALRLERLRFLHLLASMVTGLTGFAVLLHLLGGFHNLILYKEKIIGTSLTPINIYLQYDTASFALLLLGFYIPVLEDKRGWRSLFPLTVFWIPFSLVVLISFALATKIFSYDPKISSISLSWLIINLFFVVIPIEAFFRGFLQSEITLNLSNKAAPLLAILTVSLFSALVELFFLPNITFALLAFIASTLYGTIYYLTDSVESSMITHYCVNVVHFFFFTYPF